MTAEAPAALRVAAVGDLHCTTATAGTLAPRLAPVGDEADVLVLCGDLTDYGRPDEARVLARELAAARLPILAVLGNHDVESGHGPEVAAILADAGVVVLDGEVREVGGVAFAGIKGFCGGFGRHTLEPWGEPAVKAFVAEAVDEAMKLEKALARVRGVPRVALLHYAPIAGTVAGEPLEIYPFLGSTRLEEPLNRYQVTAVFHGHAHRGAPEARTLGGVPVYNVALPLLRRLAPARPYRVVEIARAADAASGPTTTPGRRASDRL